MVETVRVTVEGIEKEYASDVTFEMIANAYQKEYKDLITSVMVNGKIRELIKSPFEGCDIKFITRKDSIGHKTYTRTAVFLLVKAIYDVVGGENLEKIKVEYALSDGLYCSGKGNFVINEELVLKVIERMNDLIQKKTPITKSAYTLDDAIALFQKYNMKDKEKLFRYRRSSYVNMYCIDGFYDYFYGHMLPNAGYITQFRLELYHGGFLLLLPNMNEPNIISAFEPREKLFAALKSSNEWGIRLGIDTVGDLNNQICKGGLNEIVLVQEALQERRIGEIAKEIVSRGGVKFVMIAGPSSSGKTTFSHRLSIQLRTLGMVPHPIAIDDYFVDREKTPRDEDGNFNFECLEAIDVEQFNHDMCALLEGKEVELPSFNFKSGRREYHGKLRKMGPEDILVIEGIHGLNEKMSYSLPGESKYKIYISALTTLNVDEHNRISTTDGRMIRRMVRDARTRGITAKTTINMWSSVRRGEEANIFPFQEKVDATFNSALIYELAVLKQYAEPLLFGIEKGDPEYYEARRLLKLLEYFLFVSIEIIPNNSIVREFIGNSCFNV